MKSARRFALLLALAFVFLAPPAFADDKKDCADLEEEAGAAACTRAIQSGKYRGKELSDLYYNRAINWQDAGQIDRAIADYSEAVKHNPENAEALFNRGRAYTEKSQHDRAIEDYTASIKIDPKSPDAYNNRGRAYQEKGDADQALANFNEAIKIDPKHARAYENRADVHFRQSRFKDALDGYNKVLQIDPSRVWSIYGRGMAKMKTGDEAGGKKDISAATAKDKDIEADFKKDLGLN